MPTKGQRVLNIGFGIGMVRARWVDDMNDDFYGSTF
jgi:hypothetical protein